MGKNTKSKGRAYPKPFGGFPLSSHVHMNRWYKTIKGHRFYFDSLDDWQSILKLYDHEAPYLVCGEVPPALGQEPDTSKSVKSVINSFMDAKQRMVDAGEMTPRTLIEYHGVAKVIAATFGKHRDIETLTPPMTLANSGLSWQRNRQGAVRNQVTDRSGEPDHSSSFNLQARHRQRHHRPCCQVRHTVL